MAGKQEIEHWKRIYKLRSNIVECCGVMSNENIENLNPSQLNQLEEVKKRLLGKILDKEAYERLSRVRLVDPELTGQVELYLLQIYQSGKLRKRVNEREMKEILKVLHSKKDFKIKRK